MSSRIERLAPGQRVWVSTFHGFARGCCGGTPPTPGWKRTSPSTTPRTAPHAAPRRRPSETRRRSLHHRRRLAAAISWAKNRLIRARGVPGREGNPLGAVVQRVYPAYQAQLTQANAVGFRRSADGRRRILRDNEPLRAELDERYRYILVDEYQDTNLAQYALVRALSIDAPNLAATGDPDPVDLRLARGQPGQHPRVRAGFPRRADRQTGAQLPQHGPDPLGGRRA